jgi:hypothetical protein
VQNLREWIRWRKEQAEMREPRSVSRWWALPRMQMDSIITVLLS